MHGVVARRPPDHAVMRDCSTLAVAGARRARGSNARLRAASGTCCVYPVQSNLGSIARFRGPWTMRAGELLLKSVAPTPMPDPVGAGRQLAGAGATESDLKPAV
jgi:hypothetical protein